MLTYTNDATLKKNFLRELRKHERADAILQGTYGRMNGQWRGCAIACSLRSMAILNGEPIHTGEYGNHAAFESYGLWPEWLARLEDVIFEGLPYEEARRWPVRVGQAVPVGADLTLVKWRFCAFLLNENIERVLSLDIADALKGQVVSAIRRVLAVHTQAIVTGKWDESTAESAKSTAESAAWSAAKSTAESARSAESAVESAAWSTWPTVKPTKSAAWSVARSAWSAARSARSATRSTAESARSAVESAAYQRYAVHLLALLRGSKLR